MARNPDPFGDPFFDRQVRRTFRFASVWAVIAGIVNLVFWLVLITTLALGAFWLYGQVTAA